MEPLKSLSLHRKLLMFALGLATALGVGLMPASSVMADDDDDRFVIINGTGHSVQHDGEGPHVVINGIKHYLEGDGDDRFVVVGNRTFSVLGDDDDNHDDDDKN